MPPRPAAIRPGLRGDGMKVIHYHFGKDGGAERFFVQLVNGLAGRGVEQTAFIRPERAWRPGLEGAARIVESHFRTFSPDRILLPLKAMRMAKAEKPDALFAWMPRASRLMPDYRGCVRVTRLGDYPANLKHFDNTDVLVCNTPGIAGRVRDLGWRRGVRVISNFTDTLKVAPVDRATLATPAEAFVIVAVGRLVPRKGFPTLIDALVRMPDAILWLIGDGVARDMLERQAAANGVAGRVRFAGWQTDARPFVAAADVFAMSSNHEPLGNVVLEAWAQGKPVVSTRSEGPQWFMRDEENGLMVDIDDAEGFARAFDRLRADPALAARLAQAGERTLHEQFSKDAVVNAYLDLFRSRG